MKYFGFCAAIILCFSCSETDFNYVESTYPDGAPRKIHFCKGDSSILEKTQEFYNTSEISKEITYEEDGKTRKLEKHFHKTGELALEGAYKDGKRFGLWKSTFPDGKLMSIANYNEAGNEEGMYKVYSVFNGSHHLKYEGYYQNGARRGVWNFYNDQGVLVKKEDFSAMDER